MQCYYLQFKYPHTNLANLYEKKKVYGLVYSRPTKLMLYWLKNYLVGHFQQL